MTIGFLSHLDLNLYLFRLPIMKALVEKGHTVYAICPQGDEFSKFEQHGIHAVSYSISRKSLNPFREVKAIYNITQALKPLHLDILHTFTAKPNIYGTIAGRLAKIPTIYNLVEGLGSFYVEDDLTSKTMRKVIEFLYKQVFRYANKVVFVNEDDPHYLMRKKVIDKDKVLVIKSVGVDTDEFSFNNVNPHEIENLRTSLATQNKKVVLMIARAIWHKGIKEYYDAADQLKNENIQFILVGGTDEGNPSCADLDFLMQGNVTYLGQRQDIKELIALCDVFVLPSYREGVPRTLLEAASMCKPIVTTDTVGCREVVKTGENGFLVPIKNSTMLAEKIACLINDEKLCHTMGIRSREIAVSEFDVNVVVEQYLKLYNV